MSKDNKQNQEEKSDKMKNKEFEEELEYEKFLEMVPLVENIVIG